MNARAQRTPALRPADVPPEPAPVLPASEQFPYAPGEEIPGTNHVVVEAVGMGKWGVVYVAQHARLLKKFRTIKLLNTATDRQDDETAARIANLAYEATLIAELNHPNIVKVIDSGVTTDAKKRPYFIMEEGDARSLHKLLSAANETRRPQTSVLGAPETLQIAIEAADAVAHIHSHDIVHCDIKADNIVLQRDVAERYITKVIDFGLARHLEDDGAAPNVLGTPLFASPEQHDGERITPASDVYSLGQAFYCMTAGKAPYEDRIANGATHDDVFAALKRAHAGDAPPRPLGELVTDMPREFCELVMEMIAPSPAARPSAWTVASKLRDIERRYNVDQQARLSSAVEYETDRGGITGAFTAAPAREAGRTALRGPHGTRPLDAPPDRAARATRDVFAQRTVDVVDVSERNKTDVDAENPWWLESLIREHRARERAREEERRALLAATATRTMTPAPAAQGTTSPRAADDAAPRGRRSFADVARGLVARLRRSHASAGDVVYLEPDEAFRLAENAFERRQQRRALVRHIGAGAALALVGGVIVTAGGSRSAAAPVLHVDAAFTVERSFAPPLPAFRFDAAALREQDAPTSTHAHAARPSPPARVAPPGGTDDLFETITK